MDVSLEELLSFIQVLFLLFVHFYSYQHRPGVMYNINCWDFAGQKEFYSTHQCFLTRRSLYLVSMQSLCVYVSKDVCVCTCAHCVCVYEHCYITKFFKGGVQSVSRGVRAGVSGVMVAQHTGSCSLLTYHHSRHSQRQDIRQ